LFKRYLEKKAFFLFKSAITLGAFKKVYDSLLSSWLPSPVLEYRWFYNLFKAHLRIEHWSRAGYISICPICGDKKIGGRNNATVTVKHTVH